MTAATHRLSWAHPHRSRQVEDLCEQHWARVRAALGTLDIGSSSSVAKPGHDCVRCALRARV